VTYLEQHPDELLSSVAQRFKRSKSAICEIGINHGIKRPRGKQKATAAPLSKPDKEDWWRAEALNKLKETEIRIAAVEGTLAILKEQAAALRIIVKMGGSSEREK